MPIALRYHNNGQTGLVALCDICGEGLQHQDGIIAWFPSPTQAKGTVMNFFTVHDNKCLRELRAKHDGHPYTQEMDVAFGYLLKNSGVDLSEMQANMDELDRL